MEIGSRIMESGTLRFIGQRWTIILGAIMIALGIYMLTLRQGTIWYILSYSVMILFGFLMLANPVKSVMNNVAIYALGLGLSRILKAVPYVFNENLGVFVMGMGVLAVGASMVYTGYMFINGRARGYRRMIYTSSLVFFILIYAVSALNFAYVHGQMEIADQIGVIIETALMCLLYGCLAFVLMNDKISSHGYYEVIQSDILNLGMVNNLPADLSVSAEDADALSAPGSETWMPVTDGGPVESEHRFLIHHGNTVLYGTAQVWKGEPGVFFTISASDSGTMLQASRFRTDSLTRDDDGLRMIGRDGFASRFAVWEGAE